MQNTFLNNLLSLPKAKNVNVYEQVLIVAKRARQIVEHRKEEFYSELDKMGVIGANVAQLINTNGWQEILAKAYEEKQSPVESARQELEDGKVVCTFISSNEA